MHGEVAPRRQTRGRLWYRTLLYLAYSSSSRFKSGIFKQRSG